MKRIYIISTILILTILAFCSCDTPTFNNDTESNPTIYDVYSSSFEISDYDFKTYTTIPVSSSSKASTKSYSFNIEASCDYSLLEYTVEMRFYSSQNKLLFSDSITSRPDKDADESFEADIKISDDVYKNTYKVDVYFTGESYETPKSSTQKAISLDFCSVSFYDEGNLLLESRVKSGTTITENQIITPPKSGHAFLGWYVDRQLSNSAVFPMEIKSHTKFYANWLKTEQTINCKSTVIKDWSGNNSSAAYSITPSGFDFEQLSKEGYYLKIKITYDVYYEKDYDVPLGIGYAGSPKYEAYLYNSKKYLSVDEDMSTTTSTKTRTIEVTISAADMMNEKITLEFSTDNIQNLIYFKNIVVEYKCIK